jgi:hypothetical protein
MENSGWRLLIGDTSPFRGDGKFPIAAYSEFMPPPRVGIKPYGSFELETPFEADDPWGWTIGDREREQELQIGLASIGRQLIENVVSLVTGRGTHRIGHRHLKDNPYWPRGLAGSAALAHERHLFLSPLALAKTQDDKGRVRWTLFGGSASGPAKGFWRSFFTAPNAEIPEADALERIRKILGAAYCQSPHDLRDLKAAGFRIRPMGPLPACLDWSEGALPSWVKPYLFEDRNIAACRYLLTFTPFDLLPSVIQRAYLSGALHLLPSPASMVFWGSPLIHRLSKSLPFADQILLLQAIARHEGKGIRVHQSGWLHHPRPGHSEHDTGFGPVKNTFARTHRWQRVLRGDNDVAFAREDHLHCVLFSTHPDDVRLYGKPMARNAQIWSSDFQSVLHGLTTHRTEIANAMRQMQEGGSFGYRFFYPPMQVGQSTVFWHLPLVAFWDARSNAPQILDSGLTGYLAATDCAGFSSDHTELWPRFKSEGQPRSSSRRAKKTDADKLFEDVLGFKSVDADPSSALTFRQTATRAFEVRYWKTVADLAEGRYLNKNSGDCVNDAVTHARLPHLRPDLDLLADYLLAYYRRLAIRTGMAERVLVGDLPFQWNTDFDFPWMGGWLASQEGKKSERDVITVIPGRNRSEAIIMADHYDTAYMEDIYGERPGIRGDGSRLAARGADDNHSATAALMLGARIFAELSRKDRLDCDIWLVHLTGEEFPADCLGARALTQKLVERTLQLRQANGLYRDLSKANVRGVYVLDMIAHNNEHERDIFQISPGTTKESLWLAYQAHEAATAWAAGTKIWNRQPLRQNHGRGRRSLAGDVVPLIAQHLALYGEVRLHSNPRSTLFNTDGQIFSDAGLPTVLFMENYDINREGYHDSHDTMGNIDLDYGAAVAAIAIEAVARAASQPTI